MLSKFDIDAFVDIKQVSQHTCALMMTVVELLLALCALLFCCQPCFVDVDNLGDGSDIAKISIDIIMREKESERDGRRGACLSRAEAKMPGMAEAGAVVQAKG